MSLQRTGTIPESLLQEAISEEVIARGRKAGDPTVLRYKEIPRSHLDDHSNDREQTKSRMWRLQREKKKAKLKRKKLKKKKKLLVRRPRNRRPSMSY